MKATRVALLLATAACGGRDRVPAPAAAPNAASSATPSDPILGPSTTAEEPVRRYAIRNSAPLGMAEPLIVGPMDDLVLSPSLRLVHAWGDDAFSLSETALRTETTAGAFVAWNSDYLYLVDASTGQPRVAVPVSSVRSDQVVVAAAIDLARRRAGAVLKSGDALFWPTLDAMPITFRMPKPGPPAHDASKSSSAMAGARAPSRPGPPPRSRARTSVYNPRVIDPVHAIGEGAVPRVGFSRDGAILFAGQQAYALPDGKPLLARAADEIVLDIGDDGAIVAGLVLRTEPAESDMHSTDYRPEQTDAIVVSVDSVSFAGRRAPYGGTALGRVRAASASAHAVAFARTTGSLEWHDVRDGRLLTEAIPSIPPAPTLLRSERRITSVDVANDGAVAFVAPDRRAPDGAASAWLARDAVARPLVFPTHGGWPSAPREIALGEGSAFILTDENGGTGSTYAGVWTFDANGRSQAAVLGAHGTHVSRAGCAVLSDKHQSTFWSSCNGDRTVLPMARSADSGLMSGRVTANGARVVVQLMSAGDASRFAVFDRGAAPRTLARSAAKYTPWAVSEDGRIVAFSSDATLHVVSVDDEKELQSVALRSPLWGGIAASTHVVAAAERAGPVRILRGGRELVVDLAKRGDFAAALAISPDERLLAIGTARGRLFIVALEP